MNISRQKTQSGFALLVFLIVLMGLGGLALTGFSQQALKEVEANKLAHNKRVLQQAKQALLFYAYNYPEISKPILPGDPPPRGPGRLPCADIDNDGDANTTFGDCIALGRLPWDEPSLNLSDLRDADGQRLWYAVSENFATNVSGGNIVNSDSFGNITVRDQSGRTIFDGSDTVARSGVAAVIIAPGAVTSRNGVAQNRSVIDDDPFDTVADDDPGVIDSINYLDLVVGVEDNADFGQNSSTNGFILGPIDNNGTDVVNDQFIIITAAEVIEMAEKAVLDAYRNAVNDYLNNTDDTYPWLYNYAGVPDINGLSTYFPGNSNFATELLTNLDNFGRIPTIFTDYFTLSDSIEIESEIGGTISFNYPVGTLIGRSGGSDFKFNGGTQSLNFASASVLTNVQFSDQGGTVGRLTATAGNFEQFNSHVYFWDDEDIPTGVWTICPNGGGSLSDCNQDSAGNPTAGPNDNDLEILQMTILITLDPLVNGGVINFDADYSTPPVLNTPPFPAASITGHAEIATTFNGADVDFSPFPLGTFPPVTAYYAIDDKYEAGDSSFVVAESGTLDDVTDLILDSLTLRLRYYPELPVWAFDNGWHNAIMMAYANPYRPDLAAGCVAGTDCIKINNVGGNNDNKISILTLAGQHNWDDDLDADFINDLPTIFEGENADINDMDGTEYIFDRRAGNDVIMIIDEL